MPMLLRPFIRLFRRNASTYYRNVYTIPNKNFSYGLSGIRYFSNGHKAVFPQSYSDEQLEVVESIKLLIDKRIKPVVEQDGGDVSFVSYDPDTGYVYVRLSGACIGCAQSDVTLKHMIQGMLCHYLEEVTAVYNCDEDGYVVSQTSEELEY
ncbi:hypothetical protein BgAZ_104200 [Babesia gibsoni]|uniref:NIF system FeS cluster assembly NifU C-terminal domain-containing protein n=1 Tax=Babesia gibsoni TaxID=33632 RepID=A0AAD8PFU0_BABGI|nr:hypothetical protein BgAZ_104200 [Babesia gibsoni]